MSEWKKWKYKNSLHPLEKQVLAIIGNKRWNIKSLERALSENGQNVFQPKDTLTNFLTKRPEIFCVKGIFVWKRDQCQTDVSIKNPLHTTFKNAQNFEQKKGPNGLTFEKQILAVIKNETWKIDTLEKALMENGVKIFQSKDYLVSFLRSRPDLFDVTDTHVWKKEKFNNENPMPIFYGMVSCNIVKQSEKHH